MLELMPPFYFLTFAKVSVSVSKTFGLKKSLGIGLDEIFWSRHSVVMCGPNDLFFGSIPKIKIYDHDHFLKKTIVTNRYQGF